TGNEVRFTRTDACRHIADHLWPTEKHGNLAHLSVCLCYCLSDRVEDCRRGKKHYQCQANVPGAPRIHPHRSFSLVVHVLIWLFTKQTQGSCQFHNGHMTFFDSTPLKGGNPPRLQTALLSLRL